MEVLFVCDVSALVDADVATVGALAWLQLAARRRGCRVVFQRAPPGFCELVELMGLGDALPTGSSAFEARRQAEQREQPSGVQEEADPGDPPVPDLEDLERPRLQRLPPSGFVLPERGGPVRLDRDQP
jgi:hypothetical protein